MKTLSLFVAACCFISCASPDKEDEFPTIDGYPYYKFTDRDERYFIDADLQAGDVLVYKNQNNEMLHYEVISNEFKKSVHSSGTFSGGHFIEDYYDQQVIQLHSPDLPSPLATLRLEVSKMNYYDVSAGFNFGLWNYQLSDINARKTLTSSATTVMTVNGITYEKVVTFISDSNEPLEQWGHTRGVNKVYYDIKNGVIGFDDVFGEEWRLLPN